MATVYRALEGQIIKETDKAILFQALDKSTGDTLKQEWFPKSQVSSYGGTYDEVDGTFQFIMASEWILGQKNLLSVSISSSLIKTTDATPAFAAAYTGITKDDKAKRLPYKDDEGSDDEMENYFASLRGQGE